MSVQAIGNYWNDPYFLEALQSYNPNFKANTKNTANVANTNTNTKAENPQTINSTLVRKQEEKSDSTAGLILGGVLTLGAGCLLYKAHKKGGDKGITEGFKQIWKGLTNKADDVANKNVFAIRQNADNKWYCILPKTGRNLKVDADDFKNQAKKLGIDPDKIVNWYDKNVNLVKYTFEHDGNTITIVGGKINKVLNKDGKDIKNLILKNKNMQNKKAKIESIIEQLKKGKTPEGVTLKDVYYSHTEDDITRIFRHNLSDNSATAKLKKLRTRRFGLDENATNAYRLDNKNVDEAIKEINKNKLPKEYLNILSANCTIDSQKLKVENGKIAGIYILENGKEVLKGIDSVDYKNWLYNHPKAIEQFAKLKKDRNFTDIVYTVK